MEILTGLKKRKYHDEKTASLQPGLLSLMAVHAGQGIIIIIDIKDCFFSVPLYPHGGEHFVFTIPVKNNSVHTQRYQWKCLPQRMKNGPTVCQFYVHKVIDPVIKEFLSALVIHCMDDILLCHPSVKLLEIMLKN